VRHIGDVSRQYAIPHGILRDEPQEVRFLEEAVERTADSAAQPGTSGVETFANERRVELE
jgi:hypothetical protein